MFHVSYHGEEKQFHSSTELIDYVQKITKVARISTIARSWAGNAEIGNKISFTVSGGLLEIKCEEDLDAIRLTATNIKWQGSAAKHEWMDFPNDISIPQEVYSGLDNEEDIHDAVLDYINKQVPDYVWTEKFDIEGLDEYLAENGYEREDE